MDRKNCVVKYCYRIIGLILVFSMVCNVNVPFVKANTKDGISVKYFLTLIEQKLKLDSKKPIETALERGLVKEGEFSNYDAMLTNEGAAIIANRADIIKYGDKSTDKKKVDRARKNGRIYETVDLKIDSMDEVYGAFVKGILIGESGGMYTQWRKIYPKKNIARKDAITAVKRVEDVKKRKKMSPDGQLIRTTNLPKNYKRFDYILQAFPNSFYEMKFGFQYTKYPIEPREFIEYTYPNRIKYQKYVNSEMGVGTIEQNKEMLDQYLDEWCYQIEKNLYCRFNVNYKTIDNKWLNEIRSTYRSTGDPSYDKRKTSDIEKYISHVKRNKIVIESSNITVEPSILYYEHAYKLRCYVKFRVINITNNNYDANNIFYCAFSNISSITKSKWMERYFDIEIIPVSRNSYGEGYYVGFDELLERKDSIPR